MWHRDPLCQILNFHVHLLEKAPHQAGIEVVITLFSPNPCVSPIAMLLDIARIKIINIHENMWNTNPHTYTFKMDCMWSCKEYL
jgi:hypothetical protein